MQKSFQEFVSGTENKLNLNEWFSPTKTIWYISDKHLYDAIVGVKKFINQFMLMIHHENYKYVYIYSQILACVR